MEKCEKYWTNPNTGARIWYNKYTNIWHRLSGPAVEYDDGNKLWYINNQRYSNFLEYIQAVIKYKNNEEKL